MGGREYGLSTHPYAKEGKQMEDAAILDCGHPEFSDGRCVEMSCSNYVSKHISDTEGIRDVEGGEGPL